MIREGWYTNSMKGKREKRRGQNNLETHGKHSKLDCNSISQVSVLCSETLQRGRVVGGKAECGVLLI